MRARSAVRQFIDPSAGLTRPADAIDSDALDVSTGAGAVTDAAVSPDLAEQAFHSVPAFGLKRVGTAVRAAVATTWAATLLLTGLWVVMNGPERWPVPRELCLMGGSALLAGGQFLFLVLVADRAFPRASSRLVWGVEVLLFAAFVVGLGAALYMLAVGVGGLGLPTIAVGEAH
ncbi:MAG: hypothetical protein U0638_11685 [Phycisphaerales bacterium]